DRTEFEGRRAALDEAKEAELLAGVTIGLHRGAGAYICGEETRLLESLEGKRGQPRAKPPYPAVTGLYGAPTLINNVETVATVPKILELGGAEYAKIGTPDSTGTRVFSLSGNVVRGGNYELPNGTTLRELIYDVGGGVPDGRELKAIIPGGSSVQILTADQIDTPLAYDAMREAGSSVGSGGVASYLHKFRDEFRCHVGEGRCPYEGESSLEAVFAPVDQHRHYPTVEIPT